MPVREPAPERPNHMLAPIVTCTETSVDKVRALRIVSAFVVCELRGRARLLEDMEGGVEAQECELEYSLPDLGREGVEWREGLVERALLLAALG